MKPAEEPVAGDPRQSPAEFRAEQVVAANQRITRAMELTKLFEPLAAELEKVIRDGSGPTQSRRLRLIVDGLGRAVKADKKVIAVAERAERRERAKRCRIESREEFLVYLAEFGRRDARLSRPNTW